jgi:hypothetical protein
MLEGEFPVSEWKDCDDALTAAAAAARELRAISAERLADFLDFYANRIEKNAAALATKAHEETGLAVAPRFKDVELPRPTTQLRQGAAAAREGSWTNAVMSGWIIFELRFMRLLSYPPSFSRIAPESSPLDEHPRVHPAGLRRLGRRSFVTGTLRVQVY